jgi:hypothetical protein
MKRQQKFITTFSLIVALSSLSPVVAADAGNALGDGTVQANSDQLTGNRLRVVLTSEQLDQTRGGAGWNSYPKKDIIGDAYNAARASGANMMQFHVCYMYGVC